MSLDPVSALLSIGSKVIDRVWPNPEQAAAAKLELLKLEKSGELQVIAGQLEVNKAEAASGNLFVAGWRPAIGWICGIALFYTFIVYPMSLWALSLWAPTIIPPKLVTADMLFELLLGMLGLGGLRTVEKWKGVAS